jgi:hypothetical protein
VLSISTILNQLFYLKPTAMRVSTLFAISLLLLCSAAHAQQWDWAKDHRSNNMGQTFPPYASHIASIYDSSGSIFVFGTYIHSNSGNAFNGISLPGRSGFFAARLNEAGQTTWIKKDSVVNDPAGFNRYRVHDIAADNVGGFYVLYSKISFNSDQFEIRHYNGNGTVTAQRTGTFRPLYVNQAHYARIRLAADASGNLFIGANSLQPFIVGTDTLTRDSVPHILVAKLNSQLQKQWSLTDTAGIGNPNSVFHSIAADRQGNVIIAGSFRNFISFNPSQSLLPGNNSSNQLYIAKFNGLGQQQWIKGGVDFSGNRYSTCRDITTDTAGNIYAAGYFNSLISSGGWGLQSFGAATNAMSLKLNKDGNVLHGLAFNGLGINGEFSGQDIKVSATPDGRSSIFVSAFFLNTGNGISSTSTGFAMHFASLDTAGQCTRIFSQPVTGNMEWTRYDASFTGFDSDTGGNLLLSGAFNTTQTFGLDTLGLGMGPGARGFVAKQVKDNRQVTGVVFRDNNQNGVRDAAEPVVPNVPVEVDYKPTVVYTNANGGYVMPLGRTAATVRVRVPLHWLQTLPAGNAGYSFAAFYGDTTYSNRDFGIYPKPNIKDLRVSMVPRSAARPGFDVYCDVKYKNVGTMVQSGTVTVKLDNQYQFITSTPAPAAVNGNTLSYNYAGLQLLEERTVYMQLKLNANTPINSYVINTAQIDPVAGDSVPADNVDTSRVLVRGSFDPNDKLVSKDSVTPAMLSSLSLDYTIRFQNTGNDTAFTVVVRDTLPASLRFETLEFITASHPVQVKLNEENELECTFKNILLAYKSINEPASHGYIRFRIKPQSNLPAGSSIRNRAAIYFDFNTPIITDMAVTRVVEKIYQPPAVQTSKNIPLSIAPQPVTTPQALVQITLPAAGSAKFTLFNSQGIRLQYFEKTFVQPGRQSFEYRLPILGKGLYYLSVAQGGFRGTTEIMVQ